MAAPKTLAPCKICIRAQAFVLRCGAEGARVETAIWRTFSAIIADEDFADCFRARIHDRVDHRRGADRRWKKFALIGRFDGRACAGVVRLDRLGTLDLGRLLPGCRSQFLAAETLVDQIANTLAAAPVADLPGSLKSIFITINPRVSGARHMASTPARPFRHLEPMPGIF